MGLVAKKIILKEKLRYGHSCHVTHLLSPEFESLCFCVVSVNIINNWITSCVCLEKPVHFLPKMIHPASELHTAAIANKNPAFFRGNREIWTDNLFCRSRMPRMTRKGSASRDARGYHPCSFVVLALLAGSLVDGATVNRKSTNTASAVANANKGRGVMVPQFENAGKEPGLEIWRIEVSLNLPPIERHQWSLKSIYFLCVYNG